MPETYRAVGKVVVAYDGSAPAARTLQRFAQLHTFGAKVKVELIHVRSGSGDAARSDSDLLLMLASKYVRAHGFDHIEQRSLRGGDPGASVLAHAQSVGGDLIVAGANQVPLLAGQVANSLSRDASREE